jgi:hypothetical protein
VWYNSNFSPVAFSDWWRERFPVLLAIKGGSALDWKLRAEFKETFQESELPFRADVLDWNYRTESFRKAIETNGYECLK